jgi:5-methylcytosine-specific restriction enzyme A
MTSSTWRKRTEHADTYRANNPDRKFIQSREWRERIRPMQLSRQPLCEHCRLLGYTVAAEEVDHIERPRGDRTLQRAFTNFQSLCSSHHASKSKWERGDRKRPLVLGCGLDGYPIELPNGCLPGDRDKG